MNEAIAVVGAGIAGRLIAREMMARGEDVVVLEKSRGLGGRLATKRVEKESDRCSPYPPASAILARPK